MARLQATFILAILLAGCVAPVPKLPEARSVSISILAERDADTTVMGDHWIPDSQVAVGGRDGATTVGGSLFGIFGMGIGAAIDRSRNAAALQDTAKALALTFDRRVFEDIARRMVADRSGGMRLVRADDPQAQVQLAPYARFHALDDAPPVLTFTLQARMGERTRTGYSQRKTYVMQSPERRAFVGPGGWGDPRANPTFDAASTIAFQRLVEAFMLDLRGELPLPEPGAAQRRIKWQYITLKGDPGVGEAVVLREMPDYVLAAPVGRDVPSRYGIVVVDRAMLRE